MHVAGDLAGAANIDQLADENVALQLAAHVGRVDLHLAEAAPARLHDEHVAGDIAFDIAEDLDAAAVADLTLEEGVFSDDEYARRIFHCLIPASRRRRYWRARLSQLGDSAEREWPTR